MFKTSNAPGTQLSGAGARVPDVKVVDAEVSGLKVTGAAAMTSAIEGA